MNKFARFSFLESHTTHQKHVFLFKLAFDGATTATSIEYGCESFCKIKVDSSLFLESFWENSVLWSVPLLCTDSF
jgi:hypothetical protein